MILFKKVRYKNFLSSGNTFTEIVLNNHRNNIIIGSNGSGKSTILDALTFVLFNKPFRKINKPQLVNSINAKDCLVEVEFDIGKKSYKVIRGMKPNVFEIHVDGTMLNQDAATTDQQNFLEQHILKLNFKSFTQIVVLGSSTFIPFMQLPLASRREIIEDLLDIQVFSTMNVKLKDRIKQLNEEIKFNEKDLDLVDHKIQVQENLISELEAQSESLISEKDTKITELLGKCQFLDAETEEIKTAIDELLDDISHKDTVESKLEKFKEFKYKFKTKITTLDKENKFYQDNDNCPTCKQTLDESFKLEKISKNNSAIEETQKAWEQLEQEVSKIHDQMNSIQEIIKEIANKKSDIKNNKNHKSILENEIAQLKSEIQTIQERKNNSSKEKKDLETLQKAKTKLLEVSASNKELKDYYSVSANLLKDTGIKTRIIKRYLPVMNKLINQYLTQMDFSVNFTLSESFEETIKSRYRDVFSYSSFSEGEKSRIDIALMLTWRSVAKLKNSVDTNLLILDEIFDSSLDSTGTDELSFILRTFTQDINLFIISHREHMVEKFDRVLKFGKTKNFSKMEEVTNAVEV